MPVAGGMAPPAMANASIFASSHNFKYHNWMLDTDPTRTRKPLNHSNVGIALKVYNCNSCISADYCKLAFRQSQEGTTKPSSTKFSNRACSQGDIITAKCQLFMSSQTVINALSPHETPHYFISAAFKLAFKLTPRRWNQPLTN